MRASAIVLFASMELALGCKPQPTADTKSLDDFGGNAGLRANRCLAAPHAAAVDESAMPPLVAIGKAAEALDKTVIARTVATVPAEILQYFTAQRGRVLIIDAARDICAFRFKGASSRIPHVQGLEGVTGCALYFSAASDHAQVLSLVLPPDRKEIEHGMTRIFAALATEVLLPAVDRDSHLLASVANAVLADLATSRAFHFSAVQDLFGEVGQTEMRASLADFAALATNEPDVSVPDLAAQSSYREVFETDGARNAARRAKRLARAEHALVAEAFDSYYCNAWMPSDAPLLAAVRDGTQPVKALADAFNTRETMRVVFPRSFTAFEAAFPVFLSAVRARLGSRTNPLPSPAEVLARESDASVALSLDDGGAQMPWWQGTKAFFGNVYDNTVGATQTAYGKYTNAVQNAAYANYDGNLATTGAKALGQVASDGYNSYYDAKFDQTTKRIDTLQNGGMSFDAARANAVSLAVGDVLGTTDAAEAIGGADTTEGRDLSAEERFQRGLSGTIKISGNATMVMGLTGTGGRALTALEEGAAAEAEGAGASTLESAARSGLCLAGGVPCPLGKASTEVEALQNAKRGIGVSPEAEPAWVETEPLTYRNGSPQLGADGNPMLGENLFYETEEGGVRVLQRHAEGHPGLTGDAELPHYNPREVTPDLQVVRNSGVDGAQGHYTWPEETTGLGGTPEGRAIEEAYWGPAESPALPEVPTTPELPE